MRQRVITALVLLAVLLPTLWVSATWPFALFALVLATAGTWEWARLSGLGPRASLLYAAALAVVVAVWGMGLGGVAPLASTGSAWVWSALVLGWVLACARWMPLGPEGWQRVPQWPRLLFGWVVMGSTWWALSGAREAGVNFLLSTMCIVWVSDVSAYFAGRRWGRRRLAPSLSPGKTWEGVMGAAIGVLALSVVWMTLEARLDLGAPSLFTRARESFGWAGLVLVVGALVALGIVGDLFESMIKRAAGVKDSSGLLPGHGGVLDRVDALLPVMPAAMAVLAWGMQ